MAEDKKMLDRITRLLEIAKDPRTLEHEAESAGRMAEKLMVRYSIDAAVLAAARGDKVVDEEIVALWVALPAPYAKEKGFLLGDVARYTQCKVVLDLSKGWRKGAGAWLNGYKSDVHRTQMLFLSLVAQAMRGLLSHQARPGEDVATFRASWLIGFNGAVAARLKVAHDESVAEIDAGSGGPGTELVLSDRAGRVLAFVAQQHPDTKPITIRSSGSGRAAGRRAGQVADIGHGRLHENNQKSLT